MLAFWKAGPLVTATYPPRQQVRECRLYRFYVTHPLTGQVVLGYIGETGRQPFERLLEHLATQPWFDTVIRWEVDPQVYWGKTAVLAAEAAAIRAEKPLYNVRENEGNRGRIIPPDAIRQRRARDAEKGEARWVHPDDRGTTPASNRPPVVRRRSRWKPWQKALLWWPSVWAGTTLAGWITAVVQHWGGWKQTLTGAALTLPIVVAVFAFLLAATVKKRTRRRVWRRLLGRSR